MQAILASRIDRLPAEQKSLLQTLSIIGEVFQFGLVTNLLGKPREDLEQALSALQQAEFIYEQPAAGNIVYVFKHALTHDVAYNSVLMYRRRLLHEKIAETIEASYPASIDDHVFDLAHHYSRSSNVEKAVEYLDRAGQQAKMRGSYEEAELYLRKGLAALSTTPETSERTKREFNLQWTLWQGLSFTRGSGDNETLQVTRRLRELGQKIGTPEPLIKALAAEWNSALFEGDLTAAQRIAEELTEVAARNRSRYGMTLAHSYKGSFFRLRGELIHAMQQYQLTIDSYDERDWSGSTLQPNIRALSRLASVLWHLGWADKGRAKIREAISLSERSKSTTQILQALSVASSFYMELRESGDAGAVAERLSTLGSEEQLPETVEGSVYHGWAMAEQGQTEKGIALIRGALDSLARLGGKPYMAVALRALSEAQTRAGQLEEALASVEQAFSVVGQMRIYLFGIRWWRGELYLRLDNEKKAADDFRETLTIARAIGSKAYELRATTSLARICAKQGKRDEARAMLAEIYNWFTEGFDTADLKDAKALLDELDR